MHINSFPAILLHVPDRNSGRRAAPNKGSPERATLGHARKYIDRTEIVRLIFQETMFAVLILRSNDKYFWHSSRVKDEQQKLVHGKQVKKANIVKNVFLFCVIQYGDLFSDNAQKAEQTN